MRPRHPLRRDALRDVRVQRLGASGLSVAAEGDLLDAGLARGLKTVADLFDQRVKRKSLSRIERDRKLGLVTGTVDGWGMKSAAMVIEAVFEDLAL